MTEWEGTLLSRLLLTSPPYLATITSFKYLPIPQAMTYLWLLYDHFIFYQTTLWLTQPCSAPPRKHVPKKWGLVISFSTPRPVQESNHHVCYHSQPEHLQIKISTTPSNMAVRTRRNSCIFVTLYLYLFLCKCTYLWKCSLCAWQTAMTVMDYWNSRNKYFHYG